MPCASKVKIRVGKIPYVNVLPYYFGLMQPEGAEVDYTETYPARLNVAMRRGHLDAGMISSLEYLNGQDHYALLPGFCIGAKDFSGSVLLFSKVKLEALDGARIALTRESLSSAALLRILLKLRFKYHNHFSVRNVDPDELFKQYDAGLVIGDQALLHPPKDFFYRYDLSELWWEWTGKPFCFSVWAVQKRFAEEHAGTVSKFSEMLARNLKKNLADLEGLIAGALDIDFLDPRYSKIFGYLFNLHFSLDPAMLEGLQLFYRLAHRLGLSPRPKPFEFFGK
ncbi:MAG: menaquinone biosynthetic enzyme MqnA/MqnD family protein [Candidatus Omnitrophota bacterium]